MQFIGYDQPVQHSHRPEHAIDWLRAIMVVRCVMRYARTLRLSYPTVYSRYGVLVLRRTKKTSYDHFEGTKRISCLKYLLFLHNLLTFCLCGAHFAASDDKHVFGPVLGPV